MSDLDVLDNYKPGDSNFIYFLQFLLYFTLLDTISPDYSRSLSGVAGGGSCAKGIGCLGNGGQSNGGARKKIHTPLIRNGVPGYYGTHRSAIVVASGTQLRTPLSTKAQSCKMYVDPTTYEDPAQILAEFTNEIRPEDVEVTRVIGSGEFGEVCCGRLTVEDSYGQRQVCKGDRNE